MVLSLIIVVVLVIASGLMAEYDMQRLTTENEESDVVAPTKVDEGGDENLEMCLVGRFLTNRIHIMKDKMADVWRPFGGVTIREKELGLFLFQFYQQVDVLKVLKGGLWSFNKHILILSTMQEGLMLNQMPLFVVPFWVQVHNLPPAFMSEAVGKNLVGFMSELLEFFEKHSSGFWRSFMRL